MLGQLPRQVKPHSSLDFSAGDGVLLVVVGKSRSLNSNPLKYIIHKRVHDAHSFGRDTSVWMDLLQYLVDVYGVALLSRLSPLFLVRTWLALNGSCLLLAFLGWLFTWHGELVDEVESNDNSVDQKLAPVTFYYIEEDHFRRII